MKIIITGAGEVGFHLAKLLSYESQDITLIDPSKEKLNYANSHFDILAIKGDATSPKILKEAQVDHADLVIGLTNSETRNITIAILSKQMGCKRAIARVSNSEFIENKTVDFKKLGIDELISPEYLAAQEIQLLLKTAFTDTHEFERGALVTVGTVLDKNSKFIGKTIIEIADDFKNIKFVTIAIQRKGTLYTVIPRGDTRFEESDFVYFMVPKSNQKALYELTQKKKKRIESVMILGGGKVGHKTAMELSKEKVFVKLIEKDAKKANLLAEQLSNTMIIKGDGCDIDLLEEEDLESFDAFISVTGNSESNIMSCLLAKNRHIEKTIALVENTEYLRLSHSLGIDTLINKKLLAASSIFRYIRKGEIVDITKLNNMNAEIFEFIAQKGCKIINKEVKDLTFPRSAIIGGLIREGKGMIATGNTKILLNDRVVVCCLPEAIPKVEKLFYK